MGPSGANGGRGSRRGAARGGLGAGGRGRRDLRGSATFERVGVREGSGEGGEVTGLGRAAGAREVSHQSIVSITNPDSGFQLSSLFRTPRMGPLGANSGRGVIDTGAARSDSHCSTQVLSGSSGTR
jgi:hypothetical protein